MIQPIRALSLSRPWPWTFLNCTSPKRIENRQRKDGKMPPMCKYRGPLLLHAAQSWDTYAVYWMLERGLLTDDQRRGAFLAVSRAATHPPGVIFARCRVVGHLAPWTRSRALYPSAARVEETSAGYWHANNRSPSVPPPDLDLRWWMGGYALVLADVEPTLLVPCKGARGLWRPPPDVLAQIDRRDEGG